MKYILILFAVLYSVNTNAQIVNIPDSAFKKYLRGQGVDINGDGEIQVSEAEAIDSLRISNSTLGTDISSIVGIKSFKNLVTLEFSFIVDLEIVDISGLTNLEKLKNAAKVDTLQAIGCTSLIDLNLGANDYDKIDLQDCTSLEVFDHEANFDQLSLRNCTSLRKLILSTEILISQSQIDLDLSGCTNLTFFESNIVDILIDFDPSLYPLLDTLILLSQINEDISLVDHQNITFLQLNIINSLYVRNCPNLAEIMIDYCSSSIEIEDLSNLKTFSITVSFTDTIRIANCPILENVISPLFAVENLILKNCPSIVELELNPGPTELCDFDGLPSLRNILSRTGPRILKLEGCNNLDTFRIVGENLGVIYDFSSCINLKRLDLGEIDLLETLILQNGSSEEILTFSDPNSLMNICVDSFEFLQVQSYLNTFENVDAQVTTSCNFANGGKSFALSGTTHFDVYNDSCRTSDISLPFFKYMISDNNGGSGSFYTNDQGEFKFEVIEGQYAFGPDLLFTDYIFTTLPELREVDFPSDGSSINQDFCLIPSSEVVDVIEVNLIPLEVARPGFDTRYLITYTNTGNVTRDGDIKLTFQDQFMDFQNSNPTTDIEEEGLLVWNFENLTPFETRSIRFTMNLNSPMDAPPLNDGDILNFKAEVSPIGNQTLTVYWSYLNQEVVNSFDPNDKTCLNGNAFDQELVGDYLKYMIRFENTGSADAVNIVVIDTLDDTKFDVRTLQVINASHEVETELKDNEVKFTFRDIYLPFEDATNDGYVTFKIKTLPSLVLGDDIRNKAEIFFDFNFPIVTNTTSTVISDFTSIIELKQNTFDLDISPNPASESILISSEAKMNKIELFDISGRLLKRISFAEDRSFFNLLIDQYGTGIYFIKVYSENGNSIGKLIKE